jgi:leader peptidase (prepilin peptidase) / N-methyltransferase
MVCAAMTLFLAGLGACIGSFLNVVIYRLPRGLSVSQPRRSFCPSCETQIEWYDNIPVVSWILLKGRCRHCGSPISLQYPLVEAAGIVLTMVAWQGVRTLCADEPLEACWPALAGVLGLFWCLLGLSAMDLKEYYVDIRLTWMALSAGLVCHAISPAQAWPSGVYVTAPWGAFAVGCTLMLLILHWIWPMPQEGPICDLEAPGETTVEQVAGARPPCLTKPQASHLGPVAFLAVVTAVTVALEVVACGSEAEPLTGQMLTALGLVMLFASILAASWLPTEADEAISQAVENERSMAVRQAFREAAILGLCVLAGLGLMWLVRLDPISRSWTSLSDWTWSPDTRPLPGLTTALLGWVLAGGVCWLARVLFTMALRKEALGFGDIHIIAAAGAVLGPHLAIAGFFLAAPVALLGTLVLVFRKRYRTLPFGPWLSMGFLLALLWGRPLVLYVDNGLSGLRLLLKQ